MTGWQGSRVLGPFTRRLRTDWGSHCFVHKRMWNKGSRRERKHAGSRIEEKMFSIWICVQGMRVVDAHSKGVC